VDDHLQDLTPQDLEDLRSLLITLDLHGVQALLRAPLERGPRRRLHEADALAVHHRAQDGPGVEDEEVALRVPLAACSAAAPCSRLELLPEMPRDHHVEG